MLLTATLLLSHLDPSAYAHALSEPEDLSSTPVLQLTAEQLVSEMKRLDKYRTEFIGPLVLTASGGLALFAGFGLDVVGLYFLIVPSLVGTSAMVVSGLTIAAYVLLAVGSAVLIAGGILLAIGLTRLIPALARRRDAMERRAEIEKRLQELQPDKPAAPKDNEALRGGPWPSVLLATF